MTKNTLVAIGSIGLRRCYLNVDIPEALRRFNASDSGPYDPDYMKIVTVEFDEEFFAYEVWQV